MIKPTMKAVIGFSLGCLVLSLCCQAQQSAAGFPRLAGPYLGQTPPGNKPVVFAPGIVSTGLYTRDMAISKDGDEIYFSISDGGLSAILETRLVKGRWSEPAIASFSGRGYLDFEPHLSPEGKNFYFLSNRPPAGREAANGWTYQHIWMMTRTAGGWSEPQEVAAPVNTDDHEFFPSVTKDNVLYFTRSKKNGAARIYRAKFESGRYANPEMLPFNVPEAAQLFNAFISPQEDFLITCALNLDSTNIDQDYYISFRSPEGRWSPLTKLGPDLNPPGDNANSAYVSPDGKYLFFSSSRRDPSLAEFKSGTTLETIVKSKSEAGRGTSAIYWVDAKILEEFRPKSLPNGVS